MAPKRPLPTGNASVQFAAGVSYHKTKDGFNSLLFESLQEICKKTTKNKATFDRIFN
jgi:hypothetical protein